MANSPKFRGSHMRHFPKLRYLCQSRSIVSEAVVTKTEALASIRAFVEVETFVSKTVLHLYRFEAFVFKSRLSCQYRSICINYRHLFPS